MRRLKKIGIMASVLILLGSASVWADDAFQNYLAKKVDVYVNGNQMNADGLLVDIEGRGRTMLPIREVANELGAFVNWDAEAQVAQLFKPNVDLILTTVQQKGNNPIQYGLFQTVDVNVPAPSFVIFAQIDNMGDNSFHSYRFTIKDPSGEIIYEHEMENDVTEEIMWRTTPALKLTFDQEGLYVVEFGMKRDASERFLTVAKKSFLSK